MTSCGIINPKAYDHTEKSFISMSTTNFSEIYRE